jgi:hypothetical protein
MDNATLSRADKSTPVVIPVGDMDSQIIQVTYNEHTRTVFKAENVLMDTYGPPAYLPKTHENGKPFTIQDLRNTVMQERCKAMDSWLDNVGEPCRWFQHKAPFFKRIFLEMYLGWKT